jgi:hypothetical protein
MFFFIPKLSHPFNSNTSINFRLSERGKGVVNIFNDLGERIAILMDSKNEAGFQSFEWNVANMILGVCFYELKTENNRDAKKLL